MYKELGATNFCIMTQDIPIKTRTRLLDQSSVTTLSKFVVIESCMLRHRPATKTENFVMT